MKDPKDIAFVRIDVLENWRFWNGFRNNLEAAGREAIAEADALLAQDLTMNARAARLMSESMEFRKKKQAAGQAGGLAKANNQKPNNSQAVSPPPPIPARSLRQNTRPTKQDVYDFARQHRIDEFFARNWFARNYEERDGVDKYGSPIANWQGALTNDYKKNGGNNA